MGVQTRLDHAKERAVKKEIKSVPVDARLLTTSSHLWNRLFHPESTSADPKSGQFLGDPLPTAGVFVRPNGSTVHLTSPKKCPQTRPKRHLNSEGHGGWERLHAPSGQGEAIPQRDHEGAADDVQGPLAARALHPGELPHRLHEQLQHPAPGGGIEGPACRGRCTRRRPHIDP